MSPVGDLDADLIDTVCQEVHRIFHLAASVEVLLSDVDFAHDDSREQYHSTAILEKLASQKPPAAVRVLAITQVDLFIPILTYVYGEAQLGGKACVISTHRLAEGLRAGSPRNLFLARVAKEAAHELSHTFNLRHCKDPGCIMHYCRNIRDVDQKHDDLCRYCKVLLDDALKLINR